MQRLESIVDGDMAGKRLDIAVSELHREVSRSRAKSLIESGNITVNGGGRKAGYVTKVGDVLVIELPPVIELSLEPDDIPLEVVYEDSSLIVINKQAGLVVHPSSGTPKGTLVNALLAREGSLSSINGVARPGIVHRLDKDTSGLIVVAKTDEAHVSLQSQIAEKSAKRYYLALVDGVITKDSGEIIANIDRSAKDRKLMGVVREGGRYAKTAYTVRERFNKFTLVDYELFTGRTHQIRVHSRHIGHPIVGDVAYGGSTKLYDKGQLLHAYRLSFNHPISGERMDFYAEIPDYFETILIKLRGGRV